MHANHTSVTSTEFTAGYLYYCNEGKKMETDDSIEKHNDSKRKYEETEVGTTNVRGIIKFKYGGN